VKITIRKRALIKGTKIVFERVSLQRRFYRSVGILYNVGTATIEAEWRHFIVAQGPVAPLHISESSENSVDKLYMLLNQTDRSPILVSREASIIP
jgi:hypothetical protein